MNPVCKREVRAAVRSMKLPAIITICNGILAFVALLSMYLNVEQVKMTADIQYRSFLELYIFATVIEFIMIVFLVPALTAGVISGERERQTLDIMMTTVVSRRDVIFGKLSASLMIIFLVIVSTLPVLSLVFVYGGISWLDLGLLLLCYGVSALLAGGMGIISSSLFCRSTVSTVAAYSMTALIFLGTYGINIFASSFSGRGIAGGSAIQEAAEQSGSGGFLYLLLFNPSATFYMILRRQMDPSSNHIESWFGIRTANRITSNWIPVSMIIQLMTAALLIGLAVTFMKKERSGKKDA